MLRGHDGVFWGAEKVLYLDLGGGSTGIHL